MLILLYFLLITVGFGLLLFKKNNMIKHLDDDLKIVCDATREALFFILSEKLREKRRIDKNTDYYDMLKSEIAEIEGHMSAIDKVISELSNPKAKGFI